MQEGTNGTHDATVDGQAGSLRDELRAIAQRKVEAKTVDLSIPGYDGRLWGTFRALTDYVDQRATVIPHMDVTDLAEREVSVAVDTMLRASVTMFAKMPDGSKLPLEMRLGKPLADYLELEAENDRQAVYAVFRLGTASLMLTFNAVADFINRANGQAQGDVVGESAAAR